MPLLKCVGCDQELWWFTNKPPICQKCVSNAGQIISDLREQVGNLTPRAVDLAYTCACGQTEVIDVCINCGVRRSVPNR